MIGGKWAWAATSGVLLSAVGFQIFKRWSDTAEAAQARATRAAQYFKRFFQKTVTFDQLLADIEITNCTAAGVVDFSIVAEGPLLRQHRSRRTGKRHMHEGALMLLVDDMTGLASQATGRAGGMSVELSLSILKEVAEGETLRGQASLLRAGSTMGFMKIELRDDAGELVAIGSQLKHLGAPFAMRILHACMYHSPWIADKVHDKHLGMLQHYISKYSLKSFKELGMVSIDQAIAMKKSREQSDDPLTGNYECFVYYPLDNTLVKGHGASSAGILAEAVRHYLATDRTNEEALSAVEVKDMTVNYLTPVPDMHLVKVSVRKLSESSDIFIAEIRDQQGKICVRGRLRATV